MIIKLLPQQIPEYWETIKSSTSKSVSIDYGTLLHELLNEKIQCWVVFNESKSVQALALTRIEANKDTQKKQLHIISFISFALSNNAIYEEGMKLLLDFAKKENCESIVSDIYNEDDRNIISRFGFREKYRIYERAL